MPVRGVRGATCAQNNTRGEILAATKELLAAMVEKNQLNIEDIASAIFTVTSDLNAEFPAVAARDLGWSDTPLLCSLEIDVPGSLAKCIRVLLQVNTDQEQRQIKHVYLRDAVNLRR